MADLTIVATTVAPVRVVKQFTGPAAEVIVAGQYVRFNVTTGKVELGKATTVAEARPGGVAIIGASVAGLKVTFVSEGIVNLGSALGGSAYDADVYLSDTDGTLADTAGTIVRRVGTIVPGWGNTTADKLLDVGPIVDLADEQVALGEMADLARGSIIVGAASNRPAALDANDSGKILQGDGTDLASVAVSGDATVAVGGALTIAAGAVTNAKVTPNALDGTVNKNVANVNIIGGLTVLHRIDLAAGALAETDVILTHKTRVIDAWLVLTGAGVANTTVKVANGATAITDVMAATGADTTITRATTINDAAHEIAAAGTLRIKSETGATQPACTVYVLGIRVA